MSAAKQAACTVGAKHKWEWSRDVTRVNISINERGARKSFSRRGVFVCKCGAERLGMARSGL